MSTQNRNLTHPLRAVALALLLAAISGCAYFNTFYHAKQYFGQAEKTRSTERGQLGSTSASSNLYKQAIQKCEKIIQKYPNSKWADDAYLLMAESHYWRGDYMDAEQALDALLNFPKSELRDEALFWQGRTALAQENYRDAEAVWQSLLEKYPKFKKREEVEYFLAQAAWKGGDAEAAIGSYQGLLKRYPNGEHAALARLDLGTLLVEQKQYPEAEKIFTTVAQKGKEEDDRIQAKIQLGDVLEKQSRNEDALKLYTDLELSLDAGSRKSRMTQETRQAMELAEQEKQRAAAVADSIQQASQDPFANPNNNLDPNGTGLDPNGVPNPNGMVNQNGIVTPSSSRTLPPGLAAHQRDVNDPKQKDLAQVLIREGCVLANLGKPQDALTCFQQVVSEYPQTPFAAEAQYRIGYTYEVHLEQFMQAQVAYDGVGRQGTSAFQDEAMRRAKNLGTLRTLMATAAKDSLSQAKSAAAESRFMRAELYLFQQDNIDKAVEEYTSIEKEFAGTESAAKAGLALAWIAQTARGDSAAAMAKYTEVAGRYPDTEYGRRAREVVYGPEPDPQAVDFAGPSVAELVTPENQEAVRLQASADSASHAGPNLAGGPAPVGRPIGSPPGAPATASASLGAQAPGTPPIAPAAGAAAGMAGMAGTSPDSAALAGSGPADPNEVAGLSSPRIQPPSGPALAAGPSPAATGATPSSAGASPAPAGASPTPAGAGAGAGAVTSPATHPGAAGASLGEMVKATRENPPPVAAPDSTRALPPDTSGTALSDGAHLDPMAVPADGPTPVVVPPKPTETQPAPADTAAAPPAAKASEKPATPPEKVSKSSGTSGKNSSKTAPTPKPAKKNAQKGAAPDSTSGKQSP